MTIASVNGEENHQAEVMPNKQQGKAQHGKKIEIHAKLVVIVVVP